MSTCNPCGSIVQGKPCAVSGGGAPSGPIFEITSSDGSVNIGAPTGSVTDLTVAADPVEDCYGALTGGAGPLALPADTWVQVPLDTAVPFSSGVDLAPPVISTAGSACEGDYKLSYGLTVTVDSGVGPGGADHIQAVLSLNGAPDAGGTELKATTDWSDLLLDAGSEPMLGLQGKTIWRFIEGDSVGLYLLAASNPSSVIVNTTDMDIHRLREVHPA